jgi:hypothetical protein
MIEPFQGWWYAGRAAVAPVRDALSEELRERLYEDPHQALHVAFPKNLHQARARWNEWIQKRVVVQEPVPALYAYSQTFHMVGQERGPFTRIGIVGVVPAGAAVLPHERTIAERESGLIEALQFLRVQATPVHILAEADWGKVERIVREALVCPRLSVAGWDGVMHRVVPIQQTSMLRALQEAFQGAKLYIADGHHRWQAVRRAGLQKLLVFLTDKTDPTLWVPSAHRLLWTEEDVLEACKEYFDIRAAGARVALWQEVMGLRHAVGILAPERQAWTLRLRPKYWELLEQRPLISWLHEWVIDPIVSKGGRLEFGREWGPLVHRAQVEKAWVFAVPPLKITDVFHAAEKGQPLPPKATYFFPKVMSGLVFYEEKGPTQSPA